MRNPLSVVFVHGFLGSSRNWGPVINELKSDLKTDPVLFKAVDLFWHGNHPLRGSEEEASAPASISELSKRLHHDLRSLEGKVLWVAHSFALWPVLEIIPRFQSLGLVVEDAGPELSDAGWRQLRQIFTEIPVPFATRSAAKEYLEDHFDSAVALFLLSNLVRTQQGEQDWRFHRGALHSILNEAHDKDCWSQWRKIETNVLLVRGSRSKHLSSAVAKRMLDEGPQSMEEVVFPGVGHWVHSEARKSFCRCLVKFIKKIEQFG